MSKITCTEQDAVHFLKFYKVSTLQIVNAGTFLF